MSRLRPDLTDVTEEEAGLNELWACDEKELSTQDLRHNMYAAMGSVSKRCWDDIDDNEDAFINCMESGTRSITWDMVKSEVAKSDHSRALAQWITAGCPGPAHLIPIAARPYWGVRQNLDGVPMLSDRTIIPEKFRKQVLEVLHSAHQGVYSMILRAGETIYWPGFIRDIESTRSRCYTCHKIAPSQSDLPPTDPIVPDYPFQHVCLDHFKLNGKSYGCFADRFSNWAGVYHGDTSQDVCKVLARLCEDTASPKPARPMEHPTILRPRQRSS